MPRKTYNPGDPGNGMDKLCVAANDIAAIKSTTVSTVTSVLNESRRAAATASTGGTTVPPAISTQSDAQDEVD